MNIHWPALNVILQKLGCFNSQLFPKPLMGSLPRAAICHDVPPATIRQSVDA